MKILGGENKSLKIPIKSLFDFLVELVKVDQVVCQADVEVVLNRHVAEQVRSIVADWSSTEEAIPEVVPIVAFSLLLFQSPFLEKIKL